MAKKHFDPHSPPGALRRGMSDEEIKERAARLSRPAPSARDDVTDVESGQRGIDEKGVGGYGANEESTARRHGPPLSNHSPQGQEWKFGGNE